MTSADRFCQFWAFRVCCVSCCLCCVNKQSLSNIVDLCRREWPLTIAFCCGSITILSRQSSGPELRCYDMLRHVATCCEILPRFLHSPRPQNDLSVIQSVDGNNQEAFEPFALLCDLNSDTAHCADLCSMNCANQLGSC